MDQKKIDRINALYRKSKETGLTEAEKQEQKALRQEYINLIRGNLTSQLDNIEVERSDGTVIDLGERHRKYVRKG